MTTIFGDRNHFAIEFELFGGLSPFGRARLWMTKQWVGDLSQTGSLAYLCRKLFFMHTKRVSRTKLAFSVLPSIDDLDDLSENGNWSFGEAFDGFSLFYYAVMSERRFYFRWEMSDWLREHYSDYPVGVQYGTIDFDTYDSVVTSFLSHIFNSTIGWDELAPDL